MHNPSVADLLAASDARKEQGTWFPACGGTETVFKARSGKRLLYCYQPSTGRHAYLDVDSDMFLTDDEASAALMKF